MNLQVECIVNAANCKLDHGGGVAYAISRASGGIIEKESKGLIRKYGELEVGKACYTRAGKLKYKYVIHTVGPRWSDYKTKQESERQRCATDLERAIQSAFNTADQLRMSSIGIPPVSAGTYGVPKEICANSYASAVISKMTTKSTLKEVHFIDKDFEMVQLITDVFREFFTEHSPVCINNFQSLAGERQIFSKLSNEFQTLPSQQERHPQQFYPVHREDHSSGTFIHEFQLSTKLKLCVYTKAFETVNVQALVCGQDIYFENKGAVAEGIRKAAGMLYDIYLAEARKQKETFNIGEVVCLQEGIKYVLHVVAPKWKTKGGNKQTFLTGISKCYANVLMQAVELGINTIAVPLLGAGSKGSPTKAIAENLLKEILSLVHKVGTSCSINEIHVVNKNPDTTKVVVTLFDKHVSSEWKRLTAEEAQA
ncbi:hypothetical protein KUTeg_005146 [Tegillarca granosa]|uniref:Macro domain-containing protein n=1 Tax=Tegillarca granosa TaxID=220873 RepID=A0ABQ9FIW4_TEGGR|nr:hypothetical protein KUTeg_005146 [Tegillarca granosa]